MVLTSVDIPGTGRILAIDYGSRRIGLAVSDALQMTANALDTKTILQGSVSFLEELKNICLQENVIGVVVGKPLNMDGSEGEMVRQVKKFADKAKRVTGLPLVLWDERLTTIQAKNTLRAYGKKPSKNKAAIDKLAATFLLQSFLDSRSR